MKTLIFSLVTLFSAQVFAIDDCPFSQAAQIAYGKIDFVSKELAKKIVHREGYLRRIVGEMSDAMAEVNDCHKDMVYSEANKVFSNSQVSRLFPPSNSSKQTATNRGRS